MKTRRPFISYLQTELKENILPLLQKITSQKKETAGVANLFY